MTSLRCWAVLAATTYAVWAGELPREELTLQLHAADVSGSKPDAGSSPGDYSNAYLIDDEGKARYDLGSERGTVQRIAPDLQSRQTICTGVRFTTALAFNANGDLFGTDQEGATWLPNGNPLDELLHIIPHRHYGFPPRHPRHNPQVIDEPSVFDYGPQHQSACGMFFNDAPHGQPVFGPEFWRGDAIVCGLSRGKLYRTKLAKTSAGYAATTQLIARLQMLTSDACLAPACQLGCGPAMDAGE